MQSHASFAIALSSPVPRQSAVKGFGDDRQQCFYVLCCAVPPSGLEVWRVAQQVAVLQVTMLLVWLLLALLQSVVLRYALLFQCCAMFSDFPDLLCCR
jgi:hypothetical protein